MTDNQVQVQNLKKLGFDKSELLVEDSVVYVSCSQCLAMVINNVATHEVGCSNASKLEKESSNNAKQ